MFHLKTKELCNDIREAKEIIRLMLESMKDGDIIIVQKQNDKFNSMLTGDEENEG